MEIEQYTFYKCRGCINGEYTGLCSGRHCVKWSHTHAANVEGCINEEYT